MSKNDKLLSIEIDNFDQKIELDVAKTAIKNLEQGNVLYCPKLNFSISAEEQQLLNENVIRATTKNISFNINNNQLKGYITGGRDTFYLQIMLKRYASLTAKLIANVAPGYQNDFRIGRTSYRPKEAKGRKQKSLAKDDRLLHVDAFASQPVKNRRILRVFTNVNPNNKSRVWRLGVKFAEVVEQFYENIRTKFLFESEVLHILGITKDKRTLYDHAMLELHNKMKMDFFWQSNSPQDIYRFPSGTTWIVYTDIVSHAVVEGQYVLEQTFYPALNCMSFPELAPQAILAKKYGININKIVQ